MCKIHHAAFDSNLLGVRPDLGIEIRDDILEETVGPKLRYGLQAMHGGQLLIPKKAQLQPSSDYLERRYEAFIG